jgi:hypothetical protein
MNLRTMREHVARHNWFAVAIDFLIVVVGVFLGIQASNWNQVRETRAQAREYRGMLLADLDTNLADGVARKRYYQWVRSEALSTLAALDRPSSDLDEQFLVHAYQASQIQPWALKRNTYDEIQSVGAMASLGPPELRDQISNFYVASEVTGANMTALPPYREILRRVMPYPAQQQIRARCNERVVANLQGAVQVVVPGKCVLGLDPVLARRAIAQVHDWPGLGLDLNRWIVDLDQKLLSVDQISARAAMLKRQLEEADGQATSGSKA